AMKRGLFVSAAALENFGLTFIEASAVGLPFVGTDRGGVQDIKKHCDSGVLVDIQNQRAVHDTILSILSDAELWDSLSRHGIERIRHIYDWSTHCDTYINELQRLIDSRNEHKHPEATYERSMAKRMSTIEYLLVSDIDNTLTGDNQALSELTNVLERHHDRIGFGIATGRDINSAKHILDQLGLPRPDVLITSVGTEIYYGKDLVNDKGWSNHIRRRWKPKLIMDALQSCSELELQSDPNAQGPFKISYNVREVDDMNRCIKSVKQELANLTSACNIILSHDRYLDILPYRASKGTAVKYIAWKWHLDASHVITAGDSGNDSDMFVKPMKAIVVANHERMLDVLHKRSNVYFAKNPYAKGIIEGLRYFKAFM
ncbi:MAG: HAD-IIB family hydrolase, partial [Sphaerochaetaceae bacterium]|nr:HAD-IIB family hydrolase [Sphaerochaetaceae bacterium]